MRVSPPVLAGRGLSHTYGTVDTTPVFTDVSVEVTAGEVLAVLGPNGGGKTTLLRLLAGSLPPDRGEVLVDGTAVRRNRRGLALLRRHVQLVFQDPDDQLFSASVAQDVSFGPLNQGLGESETRERVAWALAALEIADLADAPTHLLSYGQRKRAALAGAIAMRPAVLLLDEPTAGLDPAGVEALVATLDGIREAGTTLVLSTHDVELAYRWADRALLIDRGVLAQGAVDDILTDDGLLAAARLRPCWGVVVGRALREAGMLAADAPDPLTPEEVARLSRGCLPPEGRPTGDGTTHPPDR